MKRKMATSTTIAKKNHNVPDIRVILPDQPIASEGRPTPQTRQLERPCRQT
jgi:hypothetical protein